MSYFAAAVTRTDDGWTGREMGLEEIDHLEALVEELRDLSGDGALDDPRVFLSDRRAVLGSDVAAMLWEDVALEEADVDEDDEGLRPVAEPVGESALLADLGTPSDAPLDLCAEEGLLPADVLSGVADRAGFLDVLEGLREG